MCYPTSISIIDIFRIFCIYDKICVKIPCPRNELLRLKDQNLDQILHVDKTCFLRPGHICSYELITCIYTYVAHSCILQCVCIYIYIHSAQSNIHNRKESEHNIGETFGKFLKAFWTNF